PAPPPILVSAFSPSPSPRRAHLGRRFPPRQDPGRFLRACATEFPGPGLRIGNPGAPQTAANRNARPDRGPLTLSLSPLRGARANGFRDSRARLSVGQGF